MLGESVVDAVMSKRKALYITVALTLLIWAAAQIVMPIISRTEEANFHATSSTGTVESIDVQKDLLTLTDVDGTAKESGYCMDGKLVLNCKHLSSVNSVSLDAIHVGDKVRAEHLSPNADGSLQAGLIEIVKG